MLAAAMAFLPSVPSYTEHPPSGHSLGCTVMWDRDLPDTKRDITVSVALWAGLYSGAPLS